MSTLPDYLVIYQTETGSPSFPEFIAKQDIQLKMASDSTSLSFDSAEELQLWWLKKFNTGLKAIRPGLKLAIPPKKLFSEFVYISDLVKNLKETNKTYTITSLQVQGSYAAKTGALLQDLASQSLTAAPHDTTAAAEDDIVAEPRVTTASEEDRDQCQNLLQALYKVARARFSKATDAAGLPQDTTSTSTLHKEAIKLLNNTDSSNDDKIKLLLSSVINLQNAELRAWYQTILPESVYNGLLGECNERMELLKLPEELQDDLDDLFISLKKHQYDDTVEAALGVLAVEEAKSSGDILLAVRVVKQVVQNMKLWKKGAAKSEVTYYRRFSALMDTIMEDCDVFISDGEKSSQATKDMQSITEINAKSPYGRKIDCLFQFESSGTCYDLCCNEFKRKGVSRAVLLQQASKSIRSNCCVLNDLFALNTDNDFILAMDWVGTNGYMYEVFRHDDLFASFQVAPLMVPTELFELGDFKDTLKHLFILKRNLIITAKKATVALTRERRRYHLVDVSSGPKSPRQYSLSLPIDVFHTPSKSRSTSKSKDNTKTPE